MSDFLRTMATGSEQRAALIQRQFSASLFDLPVFPLALRAFDLIAEIKIRSPSEGELSREQASRADRALQYLQGGAAAISVLTEPSRFGGDMSHLREVVAAVKGTGMPVMRKDFLVDLRQVLEARAGGASGVDPERLFCKGFQPSCNPADSAVLRPGRRDKAALTV